MLIIFHGSRGKGGLHKMMADYHFASYVAKATIVVNLSLHVRVCFYQILES